MPRGSTIGALRRWRADRTGAAALEFAMVAAPFLFMVLAIIELALHLMVQLTLDNATALAARELRTGHDASGAPVMADGASDTVGQKAFVNFICSNMSWLQGQCTGTGNLVLDVRPLATYGSTPGSPTLNPSSGAAVGACYYSGSAGTAVEVRTYFRWQVVPIPMLSSFSSYSNGASEIQSTEIFQVEPNGQTNPSQTQC